MSDLLDQLGSIPLWEWLAILFSLILSGYFSGAETVVTSFSRTRTQHLIDERDRKRDPLNLWLNSPNKLLTTLLFGNNLTNITASALATHISQKIFQHRGVAIAIGVMTLLVLIFGEITPKTFAKNNADRVIAPLMYTLTLFYYLFYPISVILTKLSEYAVNLTGGETEPTGPLVREKYLEYLIELGGEEGSLEEDKKELLNSAFEFSEIVVREVMVPRTDVVAFPSDAKLEEILSSIITTGHSRFPIYEASVDNIIGMLYAKDLLQLMENGESEFELSDCLRPVHFVPESKNISELLKEFQHQRTHIAVVVDEYGGTAGIVTLEDILEELVGEIRDEYDNEKPLIKILPDKTAIVDARIHLEDLKRVLDVPLPDKDEYETLGGFINESIGDVPQIGEKIEVDNFRFLIVEADAKRARKIKISRVPTGKEDVEGGTFQEKKATGA